MQTPPPMPSSPQGENWIRNTPPGQGPNAAPPPKRGLSGCAIAAIVGAGLVVIGIPILGILAAIAIPAYQDYVNKSKVLQAITLTAPLQQRIAESQSQSGACPDNDALGIGDGAQFRSKHVASLQTGALENGHCAIELKFTGIGVTLEGNTLILEANAPRWKCNGGSLPEQYRPLSCR